MTYNFLLSMTMAFLVSLFSVAGSVISIASPATKLIFADEIKRTFEQREEIKRDLSNFDSRLSIDAAEAVGRSHQLIDGEKRGYGTVSHIQDGIVITAGHVVNSSNCGQTFIEWGAREAEYNLVSRCKEIIYRDVGRYSDIAIFTINNIPNAEIPLDLENFRALNIHDEILLLGHMGGRDLLSSYGKITGVRKKYSVTSNFLSGSGDSGAPVFTLENGTVVGIYSGREAGIPVFTSLKKILSVINRSLDVIN